MLWDGVGRKDERRNGNGEVREAATPPRKPPPGRRARGHSHQRQQQGTSWFIRQCQSEMEASTFINNPGGKQRKMKRKEKTKVVCVQMAKWEIGFWQYRERTLTDRRCLNVATGSCDSGHGAHYHNTLTVSHTDRSTGCVITPSIQRWQQFAENTINNISSHIKQRHTPDSSTLARRLMLACHTSRSIFFWHLLLLLIKNSN